MIDSSGPPPTSAAKPVTVESSASVINPKIEPSPIQQPQQHTGPEHYEPQRQTVLMWGSAQHQQQRSTNVSPATTGPTSNGNSTIQSPAATPTLSNGGGNGVQFGGEYKTPNRLTGNIILSPESLDGSQSHQRSGSGHADIWNNRERGNPKSSYYDPNFGHAERSATEQSYMAHQQAHQIQGSSKPNGSGHSASGGGEVWSPAASSTAYHQYQYFTYHAPATHHHHHPSTQ